MPGQRRGLDYEEQSEVESRQDGVYLAVWVHQLSCGIFHLGLMDLPFCSSITCQLGHYFLDPELSMENQVSTVKHNAFSQFLRIAQWCPIWTLGP